MGKYAVIEKSFQRKCSLIKKVFLSLEPVYYLKKKKPKKGFPVTRASLLSKKQTKKQKANQKSHTECADLPDGV